VDFPPGTQRSVLGTTRIRSALTAYRFWYPPVSIEGFFNGFREAGIQDNQQLAILAAGPRFVCFTPDSDTPYAATSSVRFCRTIAFRVTVGLRGKAPTSPRSKKSPNHHS
jgi:hypothetical protein